MKAEYINPFLMSSQSIFKDAAAVELVYKSTTVKKSTVSTKNVAVMIGVTGDLRGSVIINLDESFAKEIASNMMGGMPVNDFDELPRSAVSELGNMIMGRVSTDFYTKGIKIDITPPSLMTGENIQLSIPNMPILSIKFISGNHELDLDISISEK